MFSRLFTIGDAGDAVPPPGAQTPHRSGEPHWPAIISNCTPGQRRLAQLICLVMIIGTIGLLPFARVPWQHMPFFFPMYQTAVIISCLLTAYLMYGHFKATQTVAVLHLSAGYLYTAGVLAMQCLSQKGAFLENTRLLGGAQTSIWLWFFWHFGPALSVFWFAWSESRQPGLPLAPGHPQIRNTAIALLGATLATAMLVFVFHEQLPVLDVEGDYSRITTTGVAPGLQLLLLGALLLLWRASRFRNVLHVWLGILLVALVCDNTITMMAGSRLTLGWHAGRMGALMGLSVLTLVYLQNIKKSYLTSVAVADQLALANAQLDLEALKSTQYAKKLLQADQRKDEFLAMLAHELRNPLAPITAGLAIVRMQNDPVLLVRTLDMLNRQVSQMVILIDDLLDVARVSGGKLELKKDLVDLKDIVSVAIETSQPHLQKRRHALAVQMTDEALALQADPTRIAQVIANLLNNAAKYTPDGGRIQLSLRREHGEVVISVEDNGIGLAPKNLEDVFVMFNQADSSANRAHGGLGIGLTLVRQLVEMHGGAVQAASAGLGRGSTFTVRLPLASKPVLPAVKRLVDTSAASLKRLRILVVDDHADVADTLSTILTLKGHVTEVAYNGLAALDTAAEFRPDVAFLDIGMPGMDGYATARAVRKIAGLEAVHLIALTGWGSKADRARSAAAGFDHHLTKPTPLDALDVLLAKIAAPPLVQLEPQ
ncbi:MAG: domain S-box protein [Polaromonas sp.]|nr:domain S-box protein [Polaromonas sp.]